MSRIVFESDPRKDKLNFRKHGIYFAEAETVFLDENAKLIDDPDHSDDAERFIMLGLSSNLRLLVVCHCYRGENGVVRFISARKATKPEAKQYI